MNKLDEVSFPTGDGTTVMDHQVVFLFGDMNYRIDYPNEHVRKLIKDEVIGFILFSRLFPSFFFSFLFFSFFHFLLFFFFYFDSNRIRCGMSFSNMTNSTLKIILKDHYVILKKENYNLHPLINMTQERMFMTHQKKVEYPHGVTEYFGKDQMSL